MATTYEAIATVTVGSGGAANIEFTSIPGTYTDLKLSLSVRSTLSGQLEDQLKIQINGNAVGNAFSLRRLSGDGANATSSSSTSGWIVNAINAPTSTSNTFTSVDIYFPNYAGSTYKSYSVDSVMENNATTAYAFLTAVLWSNTSAITSLKFVTNDLFAQYSTATLYGIKNS